MARVSAFGISPIPGYPMSMYQLERWAGGSHSKAAQWLARLASADVYRKFYDFDDKALDATNWWTVAAGATATTWAVAAGENGILRGITGTTAATSGLILRTDLAHFTGVGNCGMELAGRVDVVTEVRVEIGFVNAVTSVNTNFTNNLSTPTVNTVADGAWHVYDHTGSTYTTELLTAGGAGTTPNKFVDATQQLYVAATYSGGRPLAGSTKVTRLQLLQTGSATVAAVAFENGIFQAQSAANSLDAAALVWAINVKASNTTSKTYDIDSLEMWADRAPQ